MAPETPHRKPPAKGASAAPPPPEQTQLPCPRCDSMNTKFCYYNNYNFSQPRHFCKACRRYWTRGGALRDIPVGGGSRKSAKRTRCIAPPPPAAIESTASFDPVGRFAGGGGFTSLLAAGGPPAGLGNGFEEAGFAPVGRAVWAFPDGGCFGAVVGGGVNGWVVENGGGFVAGECFPTWPELAISAPGNGFK